MRTTGTIHDDAIRVALRREHHDNNSPRAHRHQVCVLLADVLRATFVPKLAPDPMLVCVANSTNVDVIRHKINGMTMNGRKI